MKAAGPRHNGAVEHALAVLEWGKVVARLVAACETDLGRARAGDAVPSFDADEVWAELDKTREADTLRNSGLPSLMGVRDVRAAVTIASKGAVCDGRSLYQVGTTLKAMGAARKSVAEADGLPLLQALADDLPDLPNIVALIEKSLESDGHVLSDASPELAAARRRKAQAVQRGQERIQSYVSGKTREWLSDPLHTTRNGRLVVPLKAEYKGKVSVEFIDVTKDPAAADEYKINVIPTQIFIDKRGKEVFRHEGFYPKADIVAQLEKMGVSNK